MSTLLQMSRGDTGVFVATILDADGEPLDLTLADITFTARRTLRGPAFLTKTLDDGISIGGSGDIGELTITIEPEDTADLTFTERFLWDVQLDDGASVVTPLIGRLVVSMDVTHVGGSGSGS